MFKLEQPNEKLLRYMLITQYKIVFFLGLLPYKLDILSFVCYSYYKLLNDRMAKTRQKLSTESTFCTNLFAWVLRVLVFYFYSEVCWLTH